MIMEKNRELIRRGMKTGKEPFKQSTLTEDQKVLTENGMKMERKELK